MGVSTLASSSSANIQLLGREYNLRFEIDGREVFLKGEKRKQAEQLFIQSFEKFSSPEEYTQLALSVTDIDAAEPKIQQLAKKIGDPALQPLSNPQVLDSETIPMMKNISASMKHSEENRGIAAPSSFIAQFNAKSRNRYLGSLLQFVNVLPKFKESCEEKLQYLQDAERDSDSDEKKIKLLTEIIRFCEEYEKNGSADYQEVRTAFASFLKLSISGFDQKEPDEVLNILIRLLADQRSTQNIRTYDYKEEKTPQGAAKVLLGFEENLSPQIYLDVEKGKSFKDLLQSYFRPKETSDKEYMVSYTGSKFVMVKPNATSHSLVKAPDELFFTMKRFVHDRTKRIKKIDDPINGDFSLSLPSEYFDDQKKANYIVDSFVVHEGRSAQSGNYITYVQTKSGWACVKDGSKIDISKSSAKEALSRAYMVHFKKVPSPTHSSATTSAEWSFTQEEKGQRRILHEIRDSCKKYSVRIREKIFFDPDKRLDDWVNADKKRVDKALKDKEGKFEVFKKQFRADFTRYFTYSVGKSRWYLHGKETKGDGAEKQTQKAWNQIMKKFHLWKGNISQKEAALYAMAKMDQSFQGVVLSKIFEKTLYSRMPQEIGEYPGPCQRVHTDIQDEKIVISGCLSDYRLVHLGDGDGMVASMNGAILCDLVFSLTIPKDKPCENSCLDMQFLFKNPKTFPAELEMLPESGSVHDKK